MLQNTKYNNKIYNIQDCGRRFRPSSEEAQGAWRAQHSYYHNYTAQ